MAFLDAPVVSIAFPQIARSLGSAATTTAWVLNAYFIAFAAGLVVAGRLADRFGRRRMFVGGLAAFGVASVACGASPDVGTLIAARVVQGLAAAIVVPAGQGLMLAEFPEGERRTAIGALAAVVGLASAAAPAIGGALIEAASWRWIFYVNVAVGLGAIAWALRLLAPDVTQRRGALPDFAGALLQAAAVGAIVLGLLEQHEWGWTDARTLACFAAFAVGVPLVLYRCAHHPLPVVDLSLLRDRMIGAANAVSLVFAIGFYAVTINAVLFLTLVWHYSVLKTGLALTPGAVAGMLVGAVAGRLADRHGPRPPAIAGGVIAAAGLLLLIGRTGSQPHYVRDWLPGALLYTGGAVALLTALVGAAVATAGAQRFAQASGLNAAVRQIGGAVGVAIVVGLVGTADAERLLGRAHSAFAVAAASAALAGVAAALLRPGAAEPAPAVAPEAIT
jgi:EmrB/QacA subfamily drug resistance transporter